MMFESCLRGIAVYGFPLLIDLLFVRLWLLRVAHLVGFVVCGFGLAGLLVWFSCVVYLCLVGFGVFMFVASLRFG